MIRRLQFFIFVLSFSSTSLLAGDNYKQTLKKIQKALNTNKELSLDFEQINYRRLRNKKSESRGYAYFSKPSKFHWAINHPRREKMIYDGKEFAKLNPDDHTGTLFSSSAGEFKNLVT